MDDSLSIYLRSTNKLPWVGRLSVCLGTSIRRFDPECPTVAKACPSRSLRAIVEGRSADVRLPLQQARGTSEMAGGRALRASCLSRHERVGPSFRVRDRAQSPPPLVAHPVPQLRSKLLPKTTRLSFFVAFESGHQSPGHRGSFASRALIEWPLARPERGGWMTDIGAKRTISSNRAGQLTGTDGRLAHDERGPVWWPALKFRALQHFIKMITQECESSSGTICSGGAGRESSAAQRRTPRTPNLSLRLYGMATTAARSRRSTVYRCRLLRRPSASRANRTPAAG